MIPCVNLVRRIDEVMPSLVVHLFSHVILHFFEVNGRNPRIRIDDRQKHAIKVDSQWPEENLLKMFGAPRHIRRLSLLLKLL